MGMPVREKRLLSSRAGYSPSERTYGVTATITDGTTVITRAFTGCTTIEGTRQAAALCDQLGPSWRVRVLSHPLSILGDLDNYGDERNAMRPESSLLSRIGRPDLIEMQPKDMGRTTQAIRNRRRKA